MSPSSLLAWVRVEFVATIAEPASHDAKTEDRLHDSLQTVGNTFQVVRWIKSQECWGTEDTLNGTVPFKGWLTIGVVELAINKIGFRSWVVQRWALVFRSPHCQRATARCWIGLFVEKDVTSPAVEKSILKVGVRYVYFSVGFPQFPHFSLLCISETFEISLT